MSPICKKRPLFAIPSTSDIQPPPHESRRLSTCRAGSSPLHDVQLCSKCSKGLFVETRRNDGTQRCNMQAPSLVAHTGHRSRVAVLISRARFRSLHCVLPHRHTLHTHIHLNTKASGPPRFLPLSHHLPGASAPHTPLASPCPGLPAPTRQPVAQTKLSRTRTSRAVASGTSANDSREGPRLRQAMAMLMVSICATLLFHGLHLQPARRLRRPLRWFVASGLSDAYWPPMATPPRGAVFIAFGTTEAVIGNSTGAVLTMRTTLPEPGVSR
jgi:hypothetical protein